MQRKLENIEFLKTIRFTPADVDSDSKLLKAKFGKAVDRTPLNDLRSGGER